jgi:hypothetical protein
MAPTTSTAVKPNSTPKTTQPLIPPDEKFWQRYSPHHEMLMSGLGSFTLHLLILGGLILAGVLGLFALLNKPEPQMEIAAMGLPGLPGTPGLPGGGGGGPGEPGDPANSNNQAKTESVNPNESPKPSGPEIEAVPLAKVSPLNLAELPNDPTIYAFADNEAVQSLKDMSKAARQKLVEGLRDSDGPTRNSPSKTGGNPGVNGAGGQGGDGAAKMNNSIKRVLRWTMLFNTRDGVDYINQLAAMGAIIAIPQDGGSQYLVVRNLKKPAEAKTEDVGTIRLIWWIDDRPESVRSLAEGLNLKQVPPHFVAFFPKELENKLVELEFRHRGLKEEQIQSTSFRIERAGNTFVPVVLQQIPLKRK